MKPDSSEDELPDGVRLLKLEPHADERGCLAELFRASWNLPLTPVQWNVVRSEAGVLRGVHVHPRHWDLLSVVSGHLVVALVDAREASPSFRRAAMLELRANYRHSLLVPPGVAHGFYHPEPSVHVYAVDREFDPADEMGCRWDDPELGIDWPAEPATVSARDEGLPSFRELLVTLGAAQARGAS